MEDIKKVIMEAIEEANIILKIASLLWPNNTMTPQESHRLVNEFISKEFPGQNYGQVLSTIQNEMASVETDDFGNDKATGQFRDDLTEKTTDVNPQEPIQSTVDLVARGQKFILEAWMDENGKLLSIDESSEIYQLGNPVFQEIEIYFDNWLESMVGRDVYKMYTGSFEEMGGGSYLSKRGAINQAIEALIQYMVEENVKHFEITQETLGTLDLEGVFQD